MAQKIRYAGYPATLVYNNEDKPVKQLLWGDWMRVTGPESDGWLPVRARNVDGFVKADEVQTERLLELVFVDIGQGDGCLLITPDDRKVLIDAGAGDNMARFLRWRFGKFEKPVRFEAAILSHSDLDHYGGFQDLFAEPNLTFGNVYTNGLMEREGKAAESLGPKAKRGRVSYLTELVRDKAELEAFVSDPAQVGRKKYPSMWKKALEGGKFENFQALSVRDGHVPGFGPGTDVVMELLGPVPEDVDGRPLLRWLGGVGPTKNGHSVVVRIRYRDVTIFAGGDLNIPSESLLLAHHTGAAEIPKDEAGRMALAEAAREKLSADFAKACHHGSADVSRAFLTALHPLATVISSGDDESYSHPRADTLGMIGKHSRGERPAIFSTELARSAPERITNPAALRMDVDKLAGLLGTELTPAQREKVAERLKENLNRSVTTYGAINLRTDGDRVVIAQKVERPKDAKSQWDYYRFERNAAGELELWSRHEDD